jgi:hypothetical protein
MYEVLQPLANLRIGKVIEQCTQDMERQVVAANRHLAANGSVLSGGAEMQKFNIRAGSLETICRNIARTWLELIRKRNRTITRDDVTFVMQQVEGFALTQAKSLGSAMVNTPGGPVVRGKFWMDQADTKMRKIAGDIRRDLRDSTTRTRSVSDAGLNFSHRQ